MRGEDYLRRPGKMATATKTGFSSCTAADKKLREKVKIARVDLKSVFGAADPGVVHYLLFDKRRQRWTSAISRLATTITKRTGAAPTSSSPTSSTRRFMPR